MRILGLAALAAVSLFAQNITCRCDPARPETMAARECSLCREAEKHPGEQEIFFLKDINPRKPGRWLALPRVHSQQIHSLADLSVDQRTKLWTAAIAKGRELFGERWGLALNGDRVRTQCHTHIHIGRLIDELETERVVTVGGPGEIPAPSDGTGIWVHPVAGGRLHVHTDEQITETVLLR